MMVKAVVSKMVDGYCGCRYAVREWKCKDGVNWYFTGNATFCKTPGDAYKWCVDRGVKNIKELGWA